MERAKILIVDDDPAVRESLKFDLETEGLTVQTYAGGRQFLARQCFEDAACLVLDCKMPDMDGFAVLAELTARNVRLPVILMTAPVTEAVRRRARGANLFNLLEKPLLNRVLAENIRRATA